jgi:hypothetical protein
MSKHHKKSKENESVDLFFASIIHRFHQALFTVDYDDPKTPNVNVFEIFNRAWIAYAEGWNKKSKKVKANPQAFYDYAINREI